MPARALVVVVLTVLVGATACTDGDPPASAPSTTAPATSAPATPPGPSATTSTSTPSDPTTTTSAPEVRPPVEPVGEVVHGSLATPDGRTRTYRLYLPTEVDPDAPLLVALHGGTGNGDQLAASSGLDGVAEANGVIAAYPDGTPTAYGDRRLVWNAEGCCGAAVRDGVDDVAFLVALVERLATDHGIDPTRVVVTGHSNGAMMGLRLACQAADHVIAVAVSAGVVFDDACAPARPVSVLALHGTADRNVPIDGGVGPESIAGVDFPPVREGLARVARAVGCEGADGPTVGPGDRPDVTVESWGPCPDGIAVELVAVEGADHRWMDDAGIRLWTFLAAHA